MFLTTIRQPADALVVYNFCICLQKQTQGHFKPGGTMYMPYREGYLKQDGNRQKIYFATKGEMLAYYKTNHEFNFGQPMAR